MRPFKVGDKVRISDRTIGTVQRVSEPVRGGADMYLYLVSSERWPITYWVSARKLKRAPFWARFRKRK